MKKLNKFFNILIGVTILCYASFFIWFRQIKSGAEVVKKIDFSSQDVDKVVNKYMQQTTEQMAKDRYESEKNINNALGQPIKLNVQKEEVPQEVSLRHQIWKESDYQQQTPADVVNTRVYDKKNSKEQDELDKKEYARQFVENARLGGYNIILSEDLKVMSVTPIRKPSQSDDSIEAFPSN